MPGAAMTDAPVQYRYWGPEKTAGRSRRGEPCVMLRNSDPWNIYVEIRFIDGATALVLRCHVRRDCAA